MGESSELMRRLSDFVKVSDLNEFRRCLSQLPPNIEPADIIDRGGYTLFHDLAMCLIPEPTLIEFVKIIEKAFVSQYGILSGEKLKKYVNLQTISENRTALHFACQNNRPTFMRHLLSLSANPSIQDLNGVTCLHAAAARGQVLLIVILVKEFHMNFQCRENKGRTPLHIAALEGQELVASLLISWSKDLNLEDNEGMTPLHLAAFSQSYRIARHLLMAGSSRKSKDSRGCTPLDIALLRGKNEISEILKEPSCFATINPMQTPLEPSSNSYVTFVLYHVVFILRNCIVLMMMVPQVDFGYGVAAVILCGVSFILYEIVSNMNPGYLEKSERSLSFLFSKYSADYVCSYCEVKRNGSVRHCQHCNRCVERFDHHCPWLHNCVGRQNFKLFFLFLTVCLADFGVQMAMGILVAMKKDAENPLYEKIFKLKEYSGGMELGIALAIFSGSCLLMVIPLWYVQLTNLVKDTTTYARFARKPKTASNSSISPGIGPSMISNKSDTPSMIIQQEDIEWTHFFSGTSMTKSLSFRERIQIVQRKTCFGICAEQEVRMRDRDSKSHIVLDGGEMKEAKS